MSGWIKLEKDLENDPRVLRVAKILSRRLAVFDTQDVRHNGAFDPCNAVAFQYVTLVCGALARLWMFADSHCRDDDTLDMSAAEIDEWLGIPGFCSVLPVDWLVELDDGRVELPGFQAHNGVEAKKRALTQKRVARHRNAQALQPDNPRNAVALPDQTKTKTRPQREGARARASHTLVRATRLPEDFTLTPQRRAVAEAEGVAPERTFGKFCDYWRAEGRRKSDWDAQWSFWCKKEAEHGRGGAQPTKQKRPPTEDEIAEARRKAAEANRRELAAKIGGIAAAGR